MNGILDLGSDAFISADGLYRYSLTRRWGRGPLLLFVMLNPSTANATEDDPTIRRCIGYARREGLPGIEVVNLFAWRSTDPAALLSASDPIGPDNDSAILDAAVDAARVVAAWGKSVPRQFRSRPAEVIRLVTACADVWCLGRTDDGTPRHPLYLKADAPFELVVSMEAAR